MGVWDFLFGLRYQKPQQVHRAEGGVAAAPLLCALWPSCQAVGWRAVRLPSPGTRWVLEAP